MTSPPPLETVVKDRSVSHNRRSRSRSVLSEGEEPVRLKSPELVLMATNTIKRGSIDGYEADTDTLKSKRGSVKNIANIFETKERSNPSPVPRPASVQSFMRLKTPDTGFTMSTAYVPPTWSNQSTGNNVHTSYNETKILRINQQSISQKSEDLNSKATISIQSAGYDLTKQSNTSSDSICNFQPKKFEPSQCQDISEKSVVNKSFQEEVKFNAKWLPESIVDLNQQQQPQYKSVKPNFSKSIV